MTKKKEENTKVHLVNAPHQIAILIDGVIQDVIATPERMCALLLSEPTFVYFSGSSLPKDSEGRDVIGQTRIDPETGEWVHTDMDATERREKISVSPWEVEESE